MNKKEEAAYCSGERATWIRLLRLAMVELGSGPEVDAARVALELHETRRALLKLADDLGYEPADLWLPDVVESLVRPHVEFGK